MSIYHNDEICNNFREYSNNPRFLNWLYNYVVCCEAGFNSDIRFRGRINKFLEFNKKQNPYIIQKIRQDYEFLAINVKLLDWIEDDPWQFLCLNKKLSPGNIFYRPGIGCKDKSILLIDSFRPGLSLNKTILVEGFKKDWHEQVVKDKKYEWFFDEHKDAKLSMLFDCVKVNNIQCDRRFFYERVDVLNFFNFLVGRSEAKLCFDATKKRWSQKKYRDNLTGKHQCNLILSDKSLKFLDEMADKYLLKRALLIEMLIRSEADKKLYIPEWVKLHKSLE